MSKTDIIYLANLASMLMGTMVVPALVAIIVRQQWNKAQKQWTAAGVSLVVGALQWYLLTYLAGSQTWMGFALTLPVIFSMAIASYNMYWKAKLGPLEAFDLLAKFGVKP